MERVVNTSTDLQEDFNWVRTYVRRGVEAEIFLLAKDVTRHGSFWEGKTFIPLSLLSQKSTKPQTVQLCNERVPFVSFILPYCALIINSFMLKNSSWNNMLLRAWKHSLQSFHPLLPPQNPNQHVNFVFRLLPPPTQSLWWNIDSSLDSKKKSYWKTAWAIPLGKAIQGLSGVWKAGRLGVRSRELIALMKVNLSDRQQKPVRTCRGASLHCCCEGRGNKGFLSLS